MIFRRQPDADQKSMFGVRYVSHYRVNGKNARLEAKSEPDSGISTHSNPFFFEFANSVRQGRAPSKYAFAAILPKLYILQRNQG